MKKILLLLILTVAFKNQYAQVNKSKDVTVASDSSQRFNLYLPGGYSGNKTYPLIIFLDPAARGDLPVSLYAGLADKYDIILAGSFNSRNFDNTSSVNAVSGIYNELLSRYKIDTSTVFLSGFSGGSRAASEITLTNKNLFHGVIACGAGFADTKITADNKIPYASTVGDKDMNYSELLEVHNNLDAIKSDNIMLVFDGGHDWPPADYMELAIVWLLQKKINPVLLDTLKNKWILHSSEKIDSDNNYSTSFDIEQLGRIQPFYSAADSLLQSFTKSKEFSKDKRKFQQALDEETTYTKGFIISFISVAGFVSIDSVKEDDWKEKILQIESMQKNKNKYMQLAGARCLDKSIRQGIEYSFLTLRTGQYIEAYNTAHIWHIFAPKNFNALYNMADAAAGFNDKKLATENLKKAIQNGMNTPGRVTADPLLLKIFSKDELVDFFKKN